MRTLLAVALFISTQLVFAQDKIYVALTSDDPIVGLDDLPQSGLNIQYLIVDAYESVLAEAKEELNPITHQTKDWIVNNQDEMRRFTAEVMERYQPDIIAAFQDKITAIELSSKYDIKTIPFVLIVNESGQYKLIKDELNVAVAFEIFQGMAYEVPK